MRLIDADALRGSVEYLPIGGVANNLFMDLIDCQTTVDAEPVVHAHWIDRDHGYNMCSHCSEECLENYDLPFSAYSFCPNCGARMDEVTDDAQT